MKDIPIIFSALMIRAMLGGTKTMTRRLAWRFTGLEHVGARGSKPSPWQRVKVGDRLWVRENFACDVAEMPPIDQHGNPTCKEVTFYAATNQTWDGPWRPSIHMPRFLSRLTLIVTATKVEPLQDISDNDAECEGVQRAIAGTSEIGVVTTFRTGFVYLWGKLHGTESWLSNPEVVAISFRVIQSNIDNLKSEAA